LAALYIENPYLVHHPIILESMDETDLLQFGLKGEKIKNPTLKGGVCSEPHTQLSGI